MAYLAIKRAKKQPLVPPDQSEHQDKTDKKKTGGAEGEAAGGSEKSGRASTLMQ